MKSATLQKAVQAASLALKLDPQLGYPLILLIIDFDFVQMYKYVLDFDASTGKCYKTALCVQFVIIV